MTMIIITVIINISIFVVTFWFFVKQPSRNTSTKTSLSCCLLG